MVTRRPRNTINPRGLGSYPTGAYDCGCIYASAPIVIDDQIFLYYGGSNGTHNGFRESSLNLATLPLDRWAGYCAGPSLGYITTTALVLDQHTFSLNVATSETGSIRAALLTETGSALNGFEFDDCAPITGDGLRLSISWSRELAELPNAPVRLRFELRDATVFAINGATRATR